MICKVSLVLHIFTIYRVDINAHCLTFSTVQVELVYCNSEDVIRCTSQAHAVACAARCYYSRAYYMVYSLLS